MKTYAYRDLVPPPACLAHPVDSTETRENTPGVALPDLARQALWTTSEAAIALRCNVRTIRRELERGSIAGVRIAREWRIPVSQFGALGTVPPTLALPLQIGKVGIEGFRAGLMYNARNSPGSWPTGLPFSVGQSRGHADGQLACQVAPVGEEVSCSSFSTVSAVAVTKPEPTLRIYLLGSPQVYVDDTRLSRLERSNRRSELIQLLGLHRSGMSVSQLASSLSMASHQYEDESLSSHYVRTLVWGIRDQCRQSAGWDGIIESPIRQGAGVHHYQLPDSTWCDLWEFEDRLDLADHILARSATPPGSPGSPCPQVSSGQSPLAWPLSVGQVSKVSEVGEVGAVSKVGKIDGFASPAYEVLGALGALGGLGAQALHDAASLREQALQLYRGAFCEGSSNGCLAQAARVLEERYKQAALQQGDYWRAMALMLILPEDMQGGAQAGAYNAYRGHPVQPLRLWGGEWFGEWLLRPAQPRRMPQAPGIHGVYRGFKAGNLALPFRATRLEARSIWREAIRNYERVLQVDSYHEEACIYAMECYANLGNKRDVDLVFDRYRDAVRSELSQAPSADVATAYECCKRLLHGGDRS